MVANIAGNMLLHALWYLRVWYLRASTEFEKNLRVSQYPIPVSLRVFLRTSTQFLKLIRVF